MTGRSWPCSGLVALAVITACASPAHESPPTMAVLAPDTPVAVTGGQIRGAVSDETPEVVAFKGIPFAAPPVGDLRWRPPAPVVAWEGVRDATAPGPVCMQGGTQEQSEDCLFLNIWAPAETTEPRPVMVWIHGGGSRSPFPRYVDCGTGAYPGQASRQDARSGVALSLHTRSTDSDGWMAGLPPRSGDHLRVRQPSRSEPSTGGEPAEPDERG